MSARGTSRTWRTTAGRGVRARTNARLWGNLPAIGHVAVVNPRLPYGLALFGLLPPYRTRLVSTPGA